MTPQQILAIGFRLTSVLLVFAGIQYMTTLPSAQEVFASTTNTPYLASAVYFLPAIFLWLFPMWTAHKILPRTVHENHINIHSIQFTRVSCCLIGLWIFSQGILNSTWHILWFFIFGGKASFVSSLAPDAQLGGVSPNPIFFRRPTSTSICKVFDPVGEALEHFIHSLQCFWVMALRL